MSYFHRMNEITGEKEKNWLINDPQELCRILEYIDLSSSQIRPYIGPNLIPVKNKNTLNTIY